MAKVKHVITAYKAQMNPQVNGVIDIFGEFDNLIQPMFPFPMANLSVVVTVTDLQRPTMFEVRLNAPDDTLTMEMVFNDRTRTEDWLSGVYNRIPDNYWDLLKVWGYDSMGDDLDPSQRWYQWWGNSLNFIIGQWFTSSTWDAAIWSANPDSYSFGLSFH